MRGAFGFHSHHTSHSLSLAYKVSTEETPPKINAQGTLEQTSPLTVENLAQKRFSLSCSLTSSSILSNLIKEKDEGVSQPIALKPKTYLHIYFLS